jgi:hypothetical protein
MSTLDIRIIDTAGYNVIPTQTWQVDSTSTILAGEPVKLSADGSPFVVRLADNEPAIGTTTQVIGITASATTATSTARGTVEVYLPLPGVVYAAKATTAANVDTQAELNALVGDRVLLDLVGSTFTVDEDAGDAAGNGIQIVGGNVANREVYFTIRPAATEGKIA